MSDSLPCPCGPHPDHLQADSFLLESGKRYQLVPTTCHLIYAEASVYSNTGTDPTYIKLFTSEDPDDESKDTELWTLPVGATDGDGAYTPAAISGLAFPHGIFARVVTASGTAEIVVNILTVRRQHFVSAFPDPSNYLARHWDTFNDGALYDNFDEGGNYGWDSSGSGGTSASELPSTPAD